jgi:hypothetical protein
MSASGFEHEDISRSGSPQLQLDGLSVELQGVYLRRLRRLLQLRKNHEGQLNFEGIRLLDKSIYATYCDCLAVGAPEAAQEVLRRSSMPLPSSGDDVSSWQ